VIDFSPFGIPTETIIYIERGNDVEKRVAQEMRKRTG
jgi:hypothetical protein